MMTFAAKLKKAMAERGMSYEMLSTVSGIGKDTILQYIAGDKEPTEEAKYILCKVLSFPEPYFDDDFDVGTTVPFARKLKKAMAEREMNMTELSAASGIGKSSLSGYLSGKNEPTKERRAVLAKALSLPEHYFDEDFAIDEAQTSNMRGKLSVTAAARLMGINSQALRVGIRMGKFPFGVCFERASGVDYFYISPKKFTEWTGIEIPRKENKEEK